jgi:hypothetical protein
VISVTIISKNNNRRRKSFFDIPSEPFFLGRRTNGEVAPL